MNARATVDERLRALAEHLDVDLAMRVRALVDAGARARRVLELEGELERAQGVLAEIRRQFDPLVQNNDRLGAENREMRKRLGIDPWTPVVAAPTVPERQP